MNILFLTLIKINSIEERGIYQDLLRKFRDQGHEVTIITPIERRDGISTNIGRRDGVTILQVKTLNIQKSNIIEKGIGTLMLEYQYLYYLKKYTTTIKFDLILYSTPPITLSKVISYIKNRDNAYSYLLLKDIFPQNAIDMKMLRPGGYLHKKFVKMEKALYEISDTIGCMSPANIDFLLKHNPEISPHKVEENPNSITPIHFSSTLQEKIFIRQKYGLPVNQIILAYGGNLGKPQGLDFLLETIRNTKHEVFFLIVGDGTEYKRMENWFLKNNPHNAMLLRSLSKQEYDKLLMACDIGLIFLNKDFIIPNFPSRLLSYLEMKLPVLVATDINTDIGDIIEDNNCGVKVKAGNQLEMQEKLNFLLKSDLSILGRNGFDLLLKRYNVDKSYDLIIKKLKNV